MANVQETSNAKEGANEQAPALPVPAPRLRLWPAMILLVLLAATRMGMYAIEDLPSVLFPVVFFGPLITCFLIVLWWLFASGARLRDRWVGFGILTAAAGTSLLFSHYSMQSMAYAFYTLPMALATFVICLFLLSAFGRGDATWVAVAAGVACFAASTQVRYHGFTGDFRASFDLRWHPSAEELYLANRRADQQANPNSQGQEAREIGAVKWPEFRGPKRDAALPGVRLSEDWITRPPRELWRHKIGPGWSSFAVTTELVYTQEQRGDSEAVVCYDAKTGSEVWNHTYRSRFWEAIGGPGPRATPTLHDGALFTLGAEGVLCRLDARTGQSAWTRDLRVDADRKPPMWGFSSSPLVTHGLVIVHAGGAGDNGVLAYDIETGAPRWQAPSGDHSYSSPQLATVAGQLCVLMLTNAGLDALDPATGKVLWQHEWKFEGYRAVQPLVLADGGVLLGTGIGSGTRRIDVKPDGTAFSITERWTTPAMKAGFNDFVAHRGHLFGFDNSVFACLDLATGTRKWKGGRYGNGQVLLLPDADQLLVIAETGELVLLRANPDRLEELARIRALTSKTWNHPVLAGNRLYLRNGEEAVCYEMSLAASP